MRGCVHCAPPRFGRAKEFLFKAIGFLAYFQPGSPYFTAIAVLQLDNDTKEWLLCSEKGQPQRMPKRIWLEEAFCQPPPFSAVMEVRENLSDKLDEGSSYDSREMEQLVSTSHCHTPSRRCLLSHTTPCAFRQDLAYRRYSAHLALGFVQE